MSLRITHNAEAAAAQRSLRVSSDRMASAMHRLSSGMRINSAADDASGLGISERLRGQIRGLGQANRNLQDGVSLLNTIDGALDAVHSILQRARELAVRYNNGTNGPGELAAIGDELIALSNEVYRIEQTTSYNGTPLLQSASTSVTLQVGANQSDTLSISMADLFGTGLQLVRSISFLTFPGGDADIAGLDQNIDAVANARARFGAVSNRLEYALNMNRIAEEQLVGAESRIRDADMAAEMLQYARVDIMQRSGTSMLAQANQQPQTLLRLLP